MPTLQLDSSHFSATMPSELIEPFGSPLPFAEPGWYGSMGHTSPYYDESHRRLREYCRAYTESLYDRAMEWEDNGEVP
jgi:hypothetical protein